MLLLIVNVFGQLLLYINYGLFLSSIARDHADTTTTATTAKSVNHEALAVHVASEDIWTIQSLYTATEV